MENQLSDSSDLKSNPQAQAGPNKRIYLSDVIDETQFKKGQANIIVAPCHSGKTTAAIAKISNLASCPEKVLFLIDTTAGKEALLKRNETQRYSQRWRKEIQWYKDGKWWGSLESGNGIRVMSYHQLGYQIEDHPDFLDAIDLVICDEMHNLLRFKDIERANNQKYGLCGTLSERKACKLAWEKLTCISNMAEGVPLVVIMTATANNLSVALHKKNVNVEYFDYSDKVTRDTAKNTIYYNDIKAVLDGLDPSERAIIYTQRVTQMKDIAKAADDGRRKICCLWSLHNEEHEMTQEQLAVRDALLENQRIPTNIDILLINAAYETSINIENEDFQTIIIHSVSPDIRTQARGRLRHDIENLYLYDPNHEHITDYFPEEYYGRFLTSADAAHIVEIMNIKDEKGKLRKWPTILALLEKDGVEVVKLKQHGVRGCILRKAV